MNTQTYTAAFVLAVLIIGGFVLYQKETPVATNVTETSNSIPNTEKIIDEDASSSIEKKDDATSETEPVKTVATPNTYEGVHIMADGTIMTKDGTVIAGAKILADGKIQLSDGTLITPAFDMRSIAAKQSTQAQAAKHVTVDVTGTDFAYDKKQIKVKKGDTVTVNFKSDGGFHDWVVDEFDAATDRVNEGEGITSVTFVADKVGTFQYYCSVMSHRQMGMVGYLIVE